ncbi:MAG: STAS domain-containing protein, partial [Bacillales bacterium]
GALVRIAAEHKFLALDMSNTQFVNFQGIRELHATAQALKNQGGTLAFIGASERLKRQFRLFAAMEPIRWYSSLEWRRDTNTSLSGRA